jgi:RNA polymerase sigma-70 factor (ECF subfamily)
MNEVEDLTLVRRARDGDEAAFQQLLERHQARVFHHARRLMGNDQDAEEVLQDTFLQVFRHLDRFEERSRFSTWVYRIATNEALMRLRKAHRKREVFLEDLPQHAGEGSDQRIRDFARSALEDAEASELIEILQRLLGELPEEYRVVFTLRDVEGLSNAEVAEVLEISVPAVKSRLHRSRIFLRDRLAAIYGDRQGTQGAKRG